MAPLDPHGLRAAGRDHSVLDRWRRRRRMVVLLHGATLDQRAWAPQAEVLRERFRLVVPASPTQ